MTRTMLRVPSDASCLLRIGRWIALSLILVLLQTYKRDGHGVAQ